MTLTVRLDPALEKRLNKLAKETGRTKSYYASRALAGYMDDLEDTYIALERLENPPKQYVTTTEVARRMGIALERSVGSKSRKNPEKTGKARCSSDTHLPA